MTSHGLYKVVGKGAKTPLSMSHGMIVPIDTEALGRMKKIKQKKVKYQEVGKSELVGENRPRLTRNDED